MFTTTSGGTVVATGAARALLVRPHLWVLILFSVLASSCQNSSSLVSLDGEQPEAPDLTEATLAIVSGNDQEAEVGQPTPGMLVVEVSDSEGVPLADVAVQWTFGNGQALSSAGVGIGQSMSSRTDSDGRSAVLWMLGPRAGAQSAWAELPGAGSSAGVTSADGGIAGAPNNDNGKKVGFHANAKPGKAEKIDVSPSSTTVPESDHVQLSAEVEDRYGNLIESSELSWSSSDESVATVDSTGMVDAVTEGTAEITAKSGPTTGTATLSVTSSGTQTPAVAAVSITPSSVTLVEGTSRLLTAEVTDQFGATMSGVQVVWSSSDASVATVDGAGTVSAVAAGSATIRATADTVAAVASVTVDVATSTSFTQTIAAYESAFQSEGDVRWNADMSLAGQKRSYYDRPYAWYALGEPARGDIDQQAYMDGYIDPNNSGVPPRHWEPDGIVEHYLRNGDGALLTSLRLMADHAISKFVNKGWVDGCCWEGRIQERALLVVMNADAMGLNGQGSFNYTTYAETIKDGILATQNADGSWTPPGSNFTGGSGQVSSNFQSAIAMSALMRYAEYYDDDVANIAAAVEKGMEWMWTTQWLPNAGAFKYYSASAPTGGPQAAADLNMLFVDTFGWLYNQTGDLKWINRGDEIFRAAVNQKTYNVGTKQFNQFFRNSWRYLFYRDIDFISSTLQNPTEIHK